jgi:hypothetical protein
MGATVMAGIGNTTPNYSIIPLTNAPNQSMRVTIPIDGRNITLGLRFRFNNVAGYWVMAISDKDGNSLLDGIPLLTGAYPAADLLGQYKHLGLGSACLIKRSNSPLDSPDSSTLGSLFQLAWGDTAP